MKKQVRKYVNGSSLRRSEKTVAEIWEQPSSLEKVEDMLLLAKESELNEKLEYFKKIANEISHICFEQKGKVSDKHRTLFVGIPMLLPRGRDKYLYRKIFRYIFSRRIFFLKQTINKDEIEIMQDYLNKAKKDPVEMACLEFIAELIFISLKEIIEDVKNEQLQTSK